MPPLLGVAPETRPPAAARRVQVLADTVPLDMVQAFGPHEVTLGSVKQF